MLTVLFKVVFLFFNVKEVLFNVVSAVVLSVISLLILSALTFSAEVALVVSVAIAVVLVTILLSALDTLFVSYPNVERRIDFDHKKKRLFQVLDMLTVIDKLDYKRKNNIPFTKAEKYFFNGKDFRHIINLLKNKRL